MRLIKRVGLMLCDVGEALFDRLDAVEERHPGFSERLGAGLVGLGALSIVGAIAFIVGTAIGAVL